MKPKTGNDKSYLWIASDFSEGEVIEEKFAILYRAKEDAEDFVKQFTAAQEFNKKVDAGETDLTLAPTVEDIIEEADETDENQPAEES